MFRTWPVRFEAMPFTDSVRSRHVPETPLTSAWPPSLPSVPTSRATRVTSSAKDESVDQGVQRLDARVPAAACGAERGALVHAALAADDAAHAPELLLHARVHRHELVVCGGDLAHEAAPPARETSREVAVAGRDERLEDLLEDRRLNPGAVWRGGL